ncbi:homing endonuclease associated repeat-containing protein [Conexibacter sp. SYSU D00693]|uniref:homing endonuclease associated repeat-containing protein n=1 Tax=Conexibacter sp. SYSU D00693 TaxID=2812560 RepID=UPI00196A5E55|nr:hypothetical protein [Conexibacter sp. SYSU D00693]
MAATATQTVFCPHCSMPFADEVPVPYPPASMRCRHCKLVVGPGRARHVPDGVSGARGAAAGRLASEARRMAKDDEGLDREVLAAALRDVAKELGRRPGQVSLVDYQQRWEARNDLPSLAQLIGTFGTWKQALAAATRVDAPPSV